MATFTTTKTTTDNGKMTFPERVHLLFLALEGSTLDAPVKTILTKTAREALYAWTDAEEAMEQVEFAQRALSSNIAWADDPIASADTLARNARAVADFVREAETKLAQANELWKAVR